MPVGFGFGVGDFVATINLLKDVADALKEHGGAVDDFKKTLRHLESTRAIVTCLEQFDNPTRRSASLSAIQRSAQHIKDEVDEFLAKIEKYKTRLGSSNSGKSFTSAALKIRWSQYVAGQVIPLYADIDREINKLQLLLSYHSLNVAGGIQKGQQSIGELLRQDAEERMQLHGSMVVLHERARGELRQDFSDLSSHISNLRAGIESTRHNHVATKDDISDLKYHLAVQTQLLTDARAEREVLTHEHGAIKDEINDLKHGIAVQTQLLHDACVQRDVPSSMSSAAYILTIPTMTLSTEMMFSRLRRFAEEVRVALELLTTFLPMSFQQMIRAIPQLMLLWQLLLQRLPQAISLVLHDNIAFEDALGRLQSLQFQQFRHWTLFATNIRCNFKGLPGCKRVLGGHFMLTSPSYKEKLTADNWSRLVRPGLVVKMGIMINTYPGCRYSHGCTSSPTMLSNDEYHCYECGVSFGIHEILEFTMDSGATKISIKHRSDSSDSSDSASSSSSDSSELQTSGLQQNSMVGPSTRPDLPRSTTIKIVSIRNSETTDEEIADEEIKDGHVFRRVHMLRNDRVARAINNDVDEEYSQQRIDRLRRKALAIQRNVGPALTCSDYDASEKATLAGLEGPKEFGGAHLCLEGTKPTQTQRRENPKLS